MFRPAPARVSLLLLALTVTPTTLAAPLTGLAHDLVTRLARAGNVPLERVQFTQQTATRDTARAFNARRYCLTDPTLTRLQHQPTNRAVQAQVFLEFRCVRTVGGQPLTPDLALALLTDMGYVTNDANLLISLLNNPPATNALLAASKHPVTPLTPRN